MSNLDDLAVEDLMTRRVRSVKPDASARAAAELLLEDFAEPEAALTYPGLPDCS